MCVVVGCCIIGSACDEVPTVPVPGVTVPWPVLEIATRNPSARIGV